LKTVLTHNFRYSYEEFADHLKAMRTVRGWEETMRFGHLGSDQTDRAHLARVLEYFSDIYERSAEAVEKAELFLLICDYLGRHAEAFSVKGLMDTVEESRFSVDPALLRAVHFLFSMASQPANVDPNKVLNLALTFKEFAPPPDSGGGGELRT
jgi:hypothetical protein